MAAGDQDQIGTVCCTLGRSLKGFNTRQTPSAREGIASAIRGWSAGTQRDDRAAIIELMAVNLQDECHHSQSLCACGWAGSLACGLSVAIPRGLTVNVTMRHPHSTHTYCVSTGTVYCSIVCAGKKIAYCYLDHKSRMRGTPTSSCYHNRDKEPRCNHTNNSALTASEPTYTHSQ
jgi:hypothetical protein